MIMRYVGAVGGVAVVVAALLLHSSNAETREQLSAKWVAAHYETLQLVTPRPFPVDPFIAAACTSQVKPAPSFSGPHAGSAISIYVNELARSALTEQSSFQSGSVIVKLKHGDAHDAHRTEAIGGMIKRDPGYDPAGGDWEFFYMEDGRLASGTLPECSACHAKATKRDRVFASWLSSSVLKATRH
ncbi:MAG TPA: cytochrome P460 family protein [Rhodanobacteraceae bacterium]|nr:cytochrome P460 family protein [Rhodanobacteraceae bacterium]